MSASTPSPTPIGDAEDRGSDDDDAAIRIAHFGALRCLRSAVEHQLRSPLNSISLNLELLAAEIADLGKGGDPQAAASALGEVLGALRGGYARLVESTDSVLNAVLPGAGKAETLDLAQLARRVAALGATESVLLRATWKTRIAPVPVSMQARRDLLVPALLSVVCLALEHSGESSRIDFSLTFGPETAEIETVIEPVRTPETAGRADESRQALARLVRCLGGSWRESADESGFRIHLSLPRVFGAPAC
ncbi:MAG: hypothetical protein ABJC13_19600 [Acidobacteriota bacterium]